MKSVVSGVAGAVRIKNLTMAGLTSAEKHGKRLDKAGKARAISRVPPVTTTGLNLNALFRAHIEGAFVPSSGSKAMHMIIQFPKDLVDGEDADGMLHHARKFAERVFGKEAIFADRVDRDEKSRHVVDLFVTPKYLKKTALQEKVAVAMTKHLKALAAEYGEPPLQVATNRALQTAFFEYLRDRMGLEKVKRGSAKQGPGPDHKAAEQLRIEELEELKAEALKARDEGREIGRKDGLAAAEQEAEKIRRTAEAEAKELLDNAELKSRDLLSAAEREARERGLAQAQELTRRERDEIAAEKLAAKKDRAAAEAELAAASAERVSAEAQSVEAEKKLSERSATLDAREKALAEDERKAAQANARATAMQNGIEAWATGDIVGTDDMTFIFRDDEAKLRVAPLILPAWNELWEAVRSLGARAAEKAAVIEAEAKQKADQLVKAAEESNAKANALKAGIEAFANGDIVKALIRTDGTRTLRWRDAETKLKLKPSIAPAWREVWEAVTALGARIAERVASIEGEVKEARHLVANAVQAASAFLKRYEMATAIERNQMSSTQAVAAVTTFVENPAIQGAICSSEGGGQDLILQAAAAGLVSGVKIPGSRAGRTS